MSVASPLSVEPPWIVHELASQWFLPATQVADRLADLHGVVDALVTSGTFVLAPPLYLGPPDHPVFRALATYVEAWHRDDRTTDFRYWDDVGKPVKVRDLLRVPGPVLAEFPVCGRLELLGEMAPLWGFGHRERPRELARLQHWLNTYGRDGTGAWRPYVIEPVGRVSAIEKWLLTGPSRLEPFGYALSFDPSGGRYVGAQVHLDEHATADLVGRAVRDAGAVRTGDLVVLALAATAADQAALDRLMRHVYTLRRRIGSSDVHGLLVADGRTVPLHRALAEQGFDFVSLTELGYRSHLRVHPEVERTLEPADGMAPHPTSLPVDLGPQVPLPAVVPLTRPAAPVESRAPRRSGLARRDLPA